MAGYRASMEVYEKNEQLEFESFAAFAAALESNEPTVQNGVSKESTAESAAATAESAAATAESAAAIKPIPELKCYKIGKEQQYFVNPIPINETEQKPNVYIALFDSSGSMGEGYMKALQELQKKLKPGDTVHLFTFGKDNRYGEYTKDTLLKHECGNRNNTYLSKSLTQLIPVLLNLLSEGHVEMLIISDGTLDDEVAAMPLIQTLSEKVNFSGKNSNLTTSCICYGNKADSFMASIAALCAGEIIIIPSNDVKALGKAICEKIGMKSNIIKSSFPNLTSSIGLMPAKSLSTKRGFFIVDNTPDGNTPDGSQISVNGEPHILKVSEYTYLEECYPLLELIEKIIINILLAKDSKQIDKYKNVITFLSDKFKKSPFESRHLKGINLDPKKLGKIEILLQTLSNQSKIDAMNASQKSDFMQGGIAYGSAAKRVEKLLGGDHPLEIIWTEVRENLSKITPEMEDLKPKCEDSKCVHDISLSTNYEYLLALLELVEKSSPEDIEIDDFMACIGFVGFGIRLPVDKKTGRPFPVTANSFLLRDIQHLSKGMPLSTCDIMRANKVGVNLHDLQSRSETLNACLPNPADPVMRIWIRYLQKTMNIIMSCFVSPIAAPMPWLYEAMMASVARYLLSIEQPKTCEVDLLRDIRESLKRPATIWKEIANKSAKPKPVFFGDEGNLQKVFAYLFAQEKISEEQLIALLFLEIYTIVRDACNYKDFNKSKGMEAMCQFVKPESASSICTPLDEDALTKYVLSLDLFPNETFWLNISSKAFMQKYPELVHNIIIQVVLCDSESDYVNKSEEKFGEPSIEFGASSIPKICAIRKQRFAELQKPMKEQEKRRGIVDNLLKDDITLVNFHLLFHVIAQHPERDVFEQLLPKSNIPPKIKSEIAMFLLLGTDGNGNKCKMSTSQALQTVLTPEHRALYRSHPNYNLENLLRPGSKVLGSLKSGRNLNPRRKNRWNYEKWYENP